MFASALEGKVVGICVGNHPQTSRFFMTVGQINILIFEIFALPLLTLKDL